MSNYVIMTDSTGDLPQSLVDSRNIHVIPMTVTMGDASFPHYPDERYMTSKEFYAKLRSGATASTSALNPEQLKDAARPFMEDGKDILYIGLSSGLTSTISAAQVAFSELAEEFPERKAYAVDSLMASFGQGMFVIMACDKRDEGMEFDALCEYLDKKRHDVCAWFTVDDLFHLKRGGRVSAATAIVGSVLNIKPILHVDEEGHLINVSKARGRKASIKALLAQMQETLIEEEKNYVYISHGDCESEAVDLANMIKEQLGVPEVVISNIGPVIGAHSGPGTIALFFIAKHR